MTSVIDSLVLEFGLDHKQFTRSEQEVLAQLKKMEEAAEKTGKNVESQQVKVNNLFAGFRREAIGLLGLLLGGYGIKEFIGHISNLDAQTGRLARTMDMSASELSAWQGAAKQVGGTAESINGTLQGMTMDMNKFMLTGQGTLQSVLRPLGISLFDNNKQLKTASELFLELADAVHGMDPARAAAYLSMIPGMNQDSINLILEGRRAIEQMLDAQRKLGTTTALSASEAQQYQKEVAQLDTAMTNLGRRILLEVAPSITKAMDDISRAFKEGLNPHIMKGSFLDFLFSGKKYDLSLSGMKEMWADFRNSLSFNPDLAEAKEELARRLNEQSAQRGVGAIAHGPVGGGNNWDRFLSGLSYLETDHRNVRNASGSSAFGFFQFMPGTAAMARKAGIGDPRLGSYDQQAAMTEAYIKRFHPDAAKLIEAGDYRGASVILRGEWPSLPGGSQAQSAQRYARFNHILAGGPTSHSKTTNVHVEKVVVNTKATDAKGIAQDIKPELERGSFSSQFNTGLN